MSPTAPDHPARTGTQHRLRRSETLRRALGLAAAVALLVGAQPALAQDTKPKRLDHVTARARRGNNISITPGVVTHNGLDQVVLTSGTKEEKVPSHLVLAIEFGDVPSTFKDGLLFVDRREFASAAASFKLAAGDEETREIVRASARLRAAEALLAWGALEPAHFAEAAEEAQRFLTDHADNREAPAAQMVLGRALLLAGDAAAAATSYRAVFDKLGADGTAAEGYAPVVCYRAGLASAQAMLSADDTLGARELFTALTNTLGPAVAALDPDALERRELQAILDEASLGEGFSELAAGNASSALTFFKNKRDGLDDKSSDSLRYGALLGLGESLLATGSHREAQLALSAVSAMHHSDRDQVARALLRMAEAGASLGDPRDRRRPLLATLDEHYGDTPWAAPAREMLKNL